MALERTLKVCGLMGLLVVGGACADGPAPPTAPSAVDSGSGLTSGTSVASTAAPTRPAANFEVRFMTGMIDHHHMAVMMAEMCIAKAVHTELRSLCENIRTAQMAEIEEMQTWLQQWYGIAYGPAMKPGDQKMMDRLASLSGAEFEIAFMEVMIKHHEKAIKEGRHCLDKAAHEELRSLCEHIIRTQSAEIAQMQAWLCQWYGECR